MSDVIDMDNERNKRSQAKGKNVEKLSPIEVYREYTNAFDGEPNRARVKFPHNIYKFENVTQSLWLQLNERNECKFVSFEWVVNALCEVSGSSFDPGFHLDYDKAAKAVKFIGANTKKRVLSLPPSISSIDSPEISFFKIPKIPEEFEQTEILTEFQERMTNFDSFAMYLARIACPELGLYRKQTVWIKGESNSGKTTLMNALSEFLGANATASYGAFLSCSTEDFDNRFFLSQTIGKRVLNIDEPNPKFIRTERFKSITGNDNHKVEMKGKDSFYAALDFGIIFTSNDEPPVKNDEAFISRIIYCELEKPRALSGKIAATRRLVDEMPNFIAYGIHLLRAHAVASYDVIPVNNTQLLDLAEDDDREFKNVFEEFFIADPQYETAYKSITEILKKCAGVNDAKKYVKAFDRIYDLKKSHARFTINVGSDKKTIDEKSRVGMKINKDAVLGKFALISLAPALLDKKI